MSASMSLTRGSVAPRAATEQFSARILQSNASAIPRLPPGVGRTHHSSREGARSTAESRIPTLCYFLTWFPTPQAQSSGDRTGATRRTGCPGARRRTGARLALHTFMAGRALDLQMVMPAALHENLSRSDLASSHYGRDPCRPADPSPPSPGFGFCVEPILFPWQSGRLCILKSTLVIPQKRHLPFSVHA